ncbi:hypothetical protein [Kitasatospora sp. A2-31]|uniref:hypothetical protein n=1 Tax=Kitasatospora sp. A2-31 TaxID=2916414 RepID=UPI001EEB34DD|nr:hypothetical protein [Kitasatospora sp. A2-31]MCG6495673.1 hypothetical protein [Kitasatospora sp. A2-31]
MSSRPERDHATDLVVRAGVLLAAAHFPNRAPAEQATWRRVVRLRDAHFFLSGHLHLWDGWSSLPTPDKVRVARVLVHRPAILASLGILASIVQEIVADGTAVDFALHGEEELLLLATGDLADRIDAILDELDEQAEKRTKRTEPATAGFFVADYYVADPLSPTGRVIETVYDLLDVTDTAGGSEIQLASPPVCDELRIPFSELQDIADTVDAELGEQHRGKAVRTFRAELRHRDGGLVGDVFICGSGPLSVLHAPTGVGKNVLAEGVALWAASKGLITSLVVPQNAQVLATVWRLRRDLDILVKAGKMQAEANAVALISPSGMQKLAEDTASSGTEDLRYREWVFREMSYSCALSARATRSTESVDSWVPGREPCDELSSTGRDTRKYACPWRASCGKFRHHRAAASASILVTNHAAFLKGRMHVPVSVDGRLVSRMTAEHLILARSHLTFIDEVDALQSQGFSDSAKRALLADHGSATTPLHALRAEFDRRCIRLSPSLENKLRGKIDHLSWVSRSYVSHLARGVITPPRARRSMVVPRRWDAIIASWVFRIERGTRPTPAQMDVVAQLFTAKGMLGKAADDVRGIAELRSLLCDITDLADGVDNLNTDRIHLIEAQFRAIAKADPDAPLPAVDVATLAQFAARRAYLEKMRRTVNQIVAHAPQMQAVGIAATNDLADAIASHVPWRAAPYGPLGRPLFAFSQDYQADEKKRVARLHLCSYVGDPHMHMAQLGDITALCHARTRRIVIGMSASAFMPFAPRHHVFRRPAWFVPDDINAGMDVELIPAVDPDTSQHVAISGTQGHNRLRAYKAMGRSIARSLAPELDAVAAEPATAHRAHALIAFTAYDAGPVIAEGMIEAGINPEEICVAVRPDDMEGYLRNPPPWTPVPADRLESFPYGTGHGNRRYLLAPMARVERGLNIVDDQGNSLLHVATLANRPVPLMEDPPVLLALVSSLSYRSMTKETFTDPATELERLRVKAGQVFEDIRRGDMYFKSLDSDVKLAIVAEIINRLTQLGGRTRRGGDHGRLRLLDAAFTETHADSTLPVLLKQLAQSWEDKQEMATIDEIYRTTMAAMLAMDARNTAPTDTIHESPFD